MKPIDFKQANVTFAKDQAEYLPLPAHRSSDGEVISCWKFSFMERLQVLFLGRVWLRTLTFNQALQPLVPQVETPFAEDKNKLRVYISMFIWKRLSGGEQPFYDDPKLAKHKAAIAPDGNAWRGNKLKLWNWAVQYLVSIGKLTYTPTMKEKF